MNTESEGASLVAILNELTELVTNARAVPMSASAMVNRSEVLDLLATARDQVPDQIVAADGLLADAEDMRAEAQGRADDIVERAQHDAEDTVAQAREQAARLVSQDAITIAAKARAQRIVDDAKSHADKLAAGADTYSDNSLLALQEQVSSIGNELESLNRTVQERIDSLIGQIIAGRNVISDRSREDEEESGEEEA